MGGEGSGRTSEVTTVGAELVMNDEQFKDCVKMRTVLRYMDVLDKLEDIIMGRDKDYVFDQKSSGFIERPPSLSDKVKAAKVWAEMTLNKVVSDKKTIDGQQQGSLLDMLEGFGDLKAAIEADKAVNAKTADIEHAAQLEGKLVRLVP